MKTNNRPATSWHNFFTLKSVALIGAACCALTACVTTPREAGFVSLFDGQSLKGWTLVGKHGAGYGVKDGVLYCAKGGGGNLYTEKEYSDFILRFEFKLEPGSNNGIGIRAPLEGDGAYVGMEIQVLEDSAPQYANLKPWQVHGSIYGVAPAKRGALRKIGEWNQEEIFAQGRHIKVTLNGKVIVDADLNNVTDAEVLQKHPGVLRDRGHIGFLGHNDYVEFRNIRIKQLPMIPRNNVPPEGFTALFNGKDLSGWKGLLAPPNDNPVKRESMQQVTFATVTDRNDAGTVVSTFKIKLPQNRTQTLSTQVVAKLLPADLAVAQVKANQRMVEHWKVINGVLEFDGKGDSLCTVKDYGDFEMLVDWKIKENGDSGIYLRGSPQVQIWDPFHAKIGSEVGSGGLYNNKKNPDKPLKRADHWIGDWNTFRILMVGEKVHVFLNGELVVNDVTLENYWDRTQPIFPTGQIELQNHGNNLYFKNIYVRELPRH